MIEYTSRVPNEYPPHVYQFLVIFDLKCQNFEVKSVNSCQILILYLDLFVRITSHVQTLLLDLVSLTYEVYL